MKRSTKDQLLINKQESRVLQHLNDSKTFIRFSNDIDDIYKSTEGYISSKNRKILNSLMMWLLISLVIKKLIQE